MALRVLSTECSTEEQPIWERETLIHLRNGDQKHLGYVSVCHLVDDFEHQGPNGIRMCLLFALMGETLRSFGAWFPESMVLNVVMRRFTIQLLFALDFDHEHGAFHTSKSLHVPYPRMPQQIPRRQPLGRINLHQCAQERHKLVPDSLTQLRGPRL